MQRISIEQLSSIAWLTKCGQPLSEYSLSCIAVQDWKEASRRCSDINWENICENARGSITEYLSNNFPDKYQGVWNKTVREIKPKVESAIVEKLMAVQNEKGVDSVIIDCVKWDVLHAVMTSLYLSCEPPLFYLHLFEVYQSGHFPCGWLGDWPEGYLAVY